MMGCLFPAKRQPKWSLLSSDESNLSAAPPWAPARHPRPQITLTRAPCDGSSSSVLSATAQSHRCALLRRLQDTTQLWHEG